MPLIILGLLVIVGIVLYALVRYGQSEDVDTRPVRERYSHVFEKIDETIDKFKNDGANYTVIDDEEDEDGTSDEDGSHTIHFPDDAESEKIKRNIH